MEDNSGGFFIIALPSTERGIEKVFATGCCGANQNDAVFHQVGVYFTVEDVG